MKLRRPTIKDSTRRFHSKKRSEQVAARAARKAANKKAKLEAEMAVANGLQEDKTQVRRENLTQVVPFLGVTDMERSTRFYIDGLSFAMKYNWTPEGKLRWCWLTRGGASIMLQEFVKEGDGIIAPDGRLGQGVSLCFQCEDAVALYREFRSRGIEAEEPFVGNSMWVTILRDPDGYKLDFESRTDVPENTSLSELEAVKEG